MSTYVIFHNEGSFSPDLVIQLKKKITVSYLFECEPKHWKWSKVPNISNYLPEDIIERTKTLKIINCRGLMFAEIWVA